MVKSQYSDKFKVFLSKLKGIKHIEIIIGVLVIAVMLVAYNSISKVTLGDTDTEVIETSSTTYDYTDTEKRLEAILCDIDGVGEVQCMITYNGTSEKVTAKTISTNTTSTTSTQGTASSTTSTTESPVIISNDGSSSPYILEEISPEITGVIIVAEGADKAVTKLAIMRACQTVLQVNASYIEIFTMK
jgi:stage III sporulation protein AG